MTPICTDTDVLVAGGGIAGLAAALAAARAGLSVRLFEQTARLCRMIYLPYFAVQGTYRLSDAELSGYARDYTQLLRRLSQGDFDVRAMQSHERLNDWLDAAAGSRP